MAPARMSRLHAVFRPSRGAKPWGEAGRERRTTPDTSMPSARGAPQRSNSSPRCVAHSHTRHTTHSGWPGAMPAG
jgi:hypothetical protein